MGHRLVADELHPNGVALYSTAVSISCWHRLFAIIISSPSRTAKGSSPMNRFALHTAWPRLLSPSVSHRKMLARSAARLTSAASSILPQGAAILKLGIVVKIIVHCGLGAVCDDKYVLDPEATPPQ
jgi:hypothetical protein